MAEDVRWQQRFGNYCKVLVQLEHFLEPPARNEREQQGLIKAFEYVFELAWNILRDLLAVRAMPRCWVRETRCGRPSGLA